ncbi:disease resistance protein RUN1-like [Eucalyptus grandis]|uniref:disease resistance protein RUN1-like n=1 Tax=Eucalyptus grandis TaxID=71139 RepID=UPI00192EF048|nr:disease resistance protein RUN1-like [Eucalyptus grandis]
MSSTKTWYMPGFVFLSITKSFERVKELVATFYKRLIIPSSTYPSSPKTMLQVIGASKLAKMVENNSKSKEDGKENAILPIFYDVKPDDVKLKTPLYRNAISNLKQMREDHEKKFSSKDIKTWQQALKEAGGITGWELEKYPGYVKLIQEVVEEVVVRLKIRQRSVTGDLVGIEARIASIKKLLDIDSNSVRLIGIYGMGGIGKTTLAKIIFDQLCPRFGRNCIFLDDVRETTKKGLVKLQKILLSEISYSRAAPNIANIDDGINKIEETICNKKMLIVLDDVDEANQIQKLIGKKSLYPGTRILVTTRDKSILNIREFKYQFEDYEMVRLSKDDALKLFSRRAFNDDSPPADYHTLSKGIVSTADGLPLALEAIEISLKVLIKRCMIKVLDNDIFEMHDQFRDLGRIKESVQALHLQTANNNRTTITAEQLRRFPHLKFLWLSNVVCEGDFTSCLSKLKWIILMGNTPTNLGLENVVVMNFRFSNPNKDEIRYLIKPLQPSVGALLLQPTSTPPDLHFLRVIFPGCLCLNGLFLFYARLAYWAKALKRTPRMVLFHPPLSFPPLVTLQGLKDKGIVVGGFLCPVSSNSSSV